MEALTQPCWQIGRGWHENAARALRPVRRSRFTGHSQNTCSLHRSVTGIGSTSGLIPFPSELKRRSRTKNFSSSRNHDVLWARLLALTGPDEKFPSHRSYCESAQGARYSGDIYDSTSELFQK
ncbi:hypothetical protein EVAR_62145_1 [Eumeta japonica]|uniref:Uncharacterized protein n=1 Tax=Eumeta variegata TaxID=151549 RepID=A0A4C1ZDS3_EUMVA|nr:hypothetical protein EVAR_62145_1 [Eumeta japonica]